MERFAYEMSVSRIQDFQKEATHERLVKEAQQANSGQMMNWFKRLFAFSQRSARQMAECRTDSAIPAHLK